MGLAGARAVQQPAGKLDPDAGRRGAGLLHSISQIAGTVASLDRQRQHRSGEDHRFHESFERIAKRSGGVGKRVGAMGNDESVIAVVLCMDDSGYAVPIFGGGVSTVDQRLEQPDIHRR